MLNRTLDALLMIGALAAGAVAGSGCSKSSTTGPGGGGGVVTVAGKVIGVNGQGVAGVPVYVTGKTSTNSDAVGGFSITGVTTPYDITVVDAAHKRAIVYKGLSRQDPTLTFFATTPGTAHTGAINGRISGGAFTPTQGVNDVTKVQFSSPEVTATLNTASSGIFGPLALSWYGPTVTTGNLYAVQFTADGAGLPVAGGFKGYGTRTGIAVNDGSTLNNQFDTLQTVATNQFTATVTFPSGYSLSTKTLSLRLSPTGLISLFNDATPNAALSYYTPGISGASLLLGAYGLKAGTESVYFKTGIATGATGISVALVAAPELSLPVNAATGVDTTVTFSWTPMTGGIHLVAFNGGANATYYVVTSGTSATIPNLKGVGLGLPSSGAYQWSVEAFGPFANADAAAGSSGLLGALANQALLTSDVFLGISTGRTFTTAP